MLDLLVAGAGPVGLVTAIHARLAGLDVAVVDPRSGPIDKACGEGLMPDAVARLARLGVDPGGVAFTGIAYLSGTYVAHARFSGAPGRGVRRTALHEALMSRARDVGVDFVDGRVDEVEQGDSWIEASGVRARYLIGADGLHSQVRRALGLQSAGDARPRFGVRQHFAVRPWTDLVEVHWLGDVELYVTPVGEELVGVAVLGRAPIDLPGAIRRTPRLAERLAGAEVASPSRGAGPLRQTVTRRTVGRALLVGDAAGYVDALTGEGLRVGFAEAEAAVQSVVTGDIDGYESDWRRITRSYRTLTNGLLWTSSRPRMRAMVVPAASTVPWVFRRIVNSLAY